MLCLQRVRLDIEDVYMPDCCSCDYVTVFDGDSTSAPTFGTFYETDIPPRITSSGSKLLVMFTSDLVISGSGFVASYEHGKG